MSYTSLTYKELHTRDLTGIQIDKLHSLSYGTFEPSDPEIFSEALAIASTDTLLDYLNKLPKQDEPLIDTYVDFLYSYKGKLSYGQALFKFLSSKLQAKKLTLVQENVIANIKGSHNEPEYPAKALFEIMQLAKTDGAEEEMIRTLKALPMPQLAAQFPEGVTEDNLNDRDWRLSSGIYKIVDKLGNLIPFSMTENQRTVYDIWVKNPRLVIDKSRQLGISTLFLVIATDLCLFSPYKSAGLISQDLKSSGILFKKVSVLLDNLPDYVYSHLNLSIDTNNTQELRFNNGSVLYIGSSFRSGTLQLLHVSEVSSIGQKDPAKIEELKTGSMQTISTDSSNSIILESTAKSGTDYFAEVFGKAKLGLNTFEAVFLSWVNDTTAVMDDCRLPINHDYFIGILPELISDGIVDSDFEFSIEQKNFYTMKLDELGTKMGQEYPTVSRESFEADFTGAIWGRQILKYKANCMHPIEFDPKQPVYASLDIGQADYTVVVFFQLFKAKGVHVVHSIAGMNEPIAYYVEKMEQYVKFVGANRLHTVFLPHDSKNRHSSSSKTVARIVSETFSVKVLKQAKLESDLAVVNELIPYVWFNANSKGVQELLTNLRSYSYKFTAGAYSNEPDHRSGSDFADAFRYCIMSPVVNGAKTIDKWKRHNIALDEEESRALHIAESKGETVTVVDGIVYTGDMGFLSANVADADEYEQELKHNRRNSTICATADDDIVDGLAMGAGAGEANLDAMNDKYRVSMGGSAKPKVSKRVGQRIVVDGLAL